MIRLRNSGVSKEVNVGEIELTRKTLISNKKINLKNFKAKIKTYLNFYHLLKQQNINSRITKAIFVAIILFAFFDRQIIQTVRKIF